MVHLGEEVDELKYHAIEHKVLVGEEVLVRVEQLDEWVCCILRGVILGNQPVLQGKVDSGKNNVDEESQHLSIKDEALTFLIIVDGFYFSFHLWAVFFALLEVFISFIFKFEASELQVHVCQQVNNDSKEAE